LIPNLLTEDSPQGHFLLYNVSPGIPAPCLEHFPLLRLLLPLHC